MITAATALYCVFGSPVSHSKSPVLHNAAFAALGKDAVYLAFEPPSARAAVQAVRDLKIQGASVTLPFKEEILPFLDRVHPDAQRIGAVNTLVVKDREVEGHNTDWQAAVDPLLAFGIQGKIVCIVGAGGAARAVAFGIAKAGGQLIITNRSREKGQALAQQLGASFVPLEAAATIQAEILINTTSLGMTPNSDQLSFPLDGLGPGMVVMDVVYTPLETALLRAARQRGCTVVDGLSMFVAQAAAQLNLWTGTCPDKSMLRQTVLSSLGDLQ